MRKKVLREATRRSPRNHSHTLQLHTKRGQDSSKLPSSLDPACAQITALPALPVEILAHIFTLCALFCTEVPDNLPLPYPPWRSITHVCRHWRTIALSHGPLWTSVTRGLSLRWTKAFMERSRTMLMDFDLRVADPRYRTVTNDLQCQDILLILAGFTRVRSLHLTGGHHTICLILSSLCHSLPIQNLSLYLLDFEREFVLPDDLFGGKASILRLRFMIEGRVVAPHWLLRSVTHFTSSESFTPSEFLDALRQMSALTYLDFRPRAPRWRESDVDELRASPIHMSQLVDLIVRAYSPNEFILLHRLLSLPAGAKRRLELFTPWLCSWFSNVGWADGLSPVLGATGGFQNVHLSGGDGKGRFRMWTGNAATIWEDAEFCLYMEWRGDVPPTSHLNDFIPMCEALGTARARRLAIISPSLGLPRSYWWELLEKFSGIEELELCPAGVDALGDAWKANNAPAVLPALRRVRIVDSELDGPSPQYAIFGDLPARRIVRLPNSTEGDITSFPEAVSAEKELKNMSSGLLRLLLQGPDRKPNSGSKKGRKKRRRR